MSSPTPPRVLVSIISGGRPKAKERPSNSFARDFADTFGWDVETVVREAHAEEYEPDGFPLNVYSEEWAADYARGHWKHPSFEYEEGGFYGAFTGREWAMRSAEERGYDLVLQMDDNIVKMGIEETTSPARFEVPYTEWMHLIAEVAMSTNASLLGLNLDSVPPGEARPLLRPGYPYSCFFEKVSPSRPAYFGPFEDDIMHALDYSTSPLPHTAAVMPHFKYLKESRSKSGMRSKYGSHRGLGLVKHYPAHAKLKVSRSTSAPMRGETQPKAVRHILNTRGFTPVKVTDRDRYLAAESQLIEKIERFKEARRRVRQAKWKQRSGAEG